VREQHLEQTLLTYRPTPEPGLEPVTTEVKCRSYKDYKNFNEYSRTWNLVTKINEYIRSPFDTFLSNDFLGVFSISTIRTILLLHYDVTVCLCYNEEGQL